MSILELSKLQVTYLAILLPIVSINLSILFYLVTRKESRSKVSKYLSYLIKPLPIKPLNSENFDKLAEEDPQRYLKKQLMVRLALVYLVITLFFVSNIIGEFYQTVSDLTMELQQSGGASRTWNQLVIETPFSSGWDGSLPWGPIPGLTNRYRTWNWVFFTGGITDNPQFLGEIIQSIIIQTFLFGMLFLIPLFVPTIRKSFVPSFFYFTTGMAIITKSIFGCFNQAWQLLLGDTTLEYGFRLITKVQLNGPSEMLIITVMLPLIISLYVIMAFIGKKLWQGHYKDPTQQHYHRWFQLYILVSYWLSLVLVMLS